MGDLISRQAAIDAISCDITITGRQNAELVAATIGAFADRIKALPSIQPEITVDGYADGFADGYKQGQKDAQPERENESVGCSGCRYDWFGDPRCNRCARSFQDFYEADMRGEQDEK